METATKSIVITYRGSIRLRVEHPGGYPER
jgi:hypothetical protein